MNKTELVEQMSQQTGLTKVDAGRAVDALIATITNELKQGQDVTLMGFGTFQTKARAARTGRNPQTGQVIQIAAATVPNFKAGKALKDAVN
jgi:DNA-binding protein HU-beta